MFWCFSVEGKCLLSSEKIFICGANLISSPAAVERCTGYHRSCELMNAMTASRTLRWEDPMHPPAPISWPGHSAGRTICIPQLPYHDQDVEPGGPSASHNSHIFLPPLHNIPFEVSRRWYSFSSRAEQPTVTYSQFFDQLGDSTFIIHHTDFCDKDREQH